MAKLREKLSPSFVTRMSTPRLAASLVTRTKSAPRVHLPIAADLAGRSEAVGMAAFAQSSQRLAQSLIASRYQLQKSSRCRGVRAVIEKGGLPRRTN